MNIAMVVYVLGLVCLCEGALLLLPVVVGICYMEAATWSLVITAVLCVVIGWMFVRNKPVKRMMYQREGMVITALTWIIISILGALPFLIAGAIKDPVDALFETVSGFTTTGASILPQVENLPKCLLFWRSLTHWIGGMGVLVFLLTLLPLTGGSHVNLMKAESPGPQVEKLVPKMQTTAKILYGIYLGLTALEVIFLLAGGMTVFEALTTAFGTAGTGGFGIKNDSIASYSPYIQVVVGVFMMLFGINFNFYFFLLLRKWSKAAAMEEVWTYLGIIGLSTAVICINISKMFSTFGEGLRHAFLTVSSIITTTGFATTDFDIWPEFSKTLLVILMFIGACAGSTGGGFKVSRVLILARNVRRECKHTLHPQSVSVLHMDGKPLPEAVLKSTNSFLVSYVCLFFVSLLLVSLDNRDFTTGFTAVAATLNNIGPGLNAVGPTQNFAFFSWPVKLILILDMLAGRLEIFPILLLFSKDTWKKF